MPVIYWDGCSFIDGMIFELFGADGTQLDIKGLPMLCLDNVQTLDEGSLLVAKFTFQGTLYTVQGRAYEAAVGTYTIRARFGWWTDLGSDSGFESTAERSFRWKPASE